MRGRVGRFCVHAGALAAHVQMLERYVAMFLDGLPVGASTLEALRDAFQARRPRWTAMGTASILQLFAEQNFADAAFEAAALARWQSHFAASGTRRSTLGALKRTAMLWQLHGRCVQMPPAVLERARTAGLATVRSTPSVPQKYLTTVRGALSLPNKEQQHPAAVRSALSTPPAACLLLHPARSCLQCGFMQVVRVSPAQRHIFVAVTSLFGRSCHLEHVACDGKLVIDIAVVRAGTRVGPPKIAIECDGSQHYWSNTHPRQPTLKTLQRNALLERDGWSVVVVDTFDWTRCTWAPDGGRRRELGRQFIIDLFNHLGLGECLPAEHRQAVAD
jgi:hypothetical protein